MNEIQVPLDEWQGESGVYVIRDKEEKIFVCIEYRKDKHTGEVKEVKHRVPEKKVLNIWKIICEHIDMIPVHNFKDKELKKRYNLEYRPLSESVIEFYDLSVSQEAFNGGGGNRAWYYFPHYYYPIKVVEFYGNIRYGRNSIYRLNKNLVLK